MAKIVFLMADGCEEVEALTGVDILRRAGFDVDMAGLSGETLIKGAHGIDIKADIFIDSINIKEYDAVVLPGGAPGYKNLSNDERVRSLVIEANKENKLIAAICAAPTVLGGFGLLEGKNACCYPGMEDGLIKANVKEDAVVVDGNFITSRGVGTAIDFALSIVEYFTDKITADNLGKTFVWNRQ